MTFWRTLITPGYLSHHSILDLNCHLRGTECRASATWFCNVPFYPESHHPKCRLSLGEVHTNVCMYTYIIYWTAGSSTILVFIALLLSAYFRLDLLLTRLNEKILTFFSIVLDIFSIISHFIPCSNIVRVGSSTRQNKKVKQNKTKQKHAPQVWTQKRPLLKSEEVPTSAAVSIYLPWGCDDPWHRLRLTLVA